MSTTTRCSPAVWSDYWGAFVTMIGLGEYDTVCECCGRRIVVGECKSCEQDRRDGEEFVRKHGLPWDHPRATAIEKSETESAYPNSGGSAGA